MTIYTAENSGGEIVIVHGSPAFGRDSFITYTLNVMRELDGDDPNAARLDLYEWADPVEAGIWLQGKEPMPFTTWPEMGRRACFGRVEYCWPGRHLFLEPSEQAPRPLSERADLPFPPVSGDEYPLDDPKHPTYHDRMATIHDLRDKGK